MDSIHYMTAILNKGGTERKRNKKNENNNE